MLQGAQFKVDGVSVPTNFSFSLTLALSKYSVWKLALGRTSSKKPRITDNLHRVEGVGWGVAVYKMERLRSTILKKK